MEKISVIIPVYNVAPFIRKCIDELLNQTYQNFEILLVDDCSQDESLEILREYQQKDPRVIVLHQEQNQGVSAARNRALDAATGEWLCFCDGDDWYLPNYLEKMLETAKKEQADYVVCDYQIVSDSKRPVKSGSTSALFSGCDPRLMIACGPTASWSHMFRRELLEKSGLRYPLGRKQYEEIPIISVLPKYAKRVGVCQDALYCYYQRGDGSSASNKADQSEQNFILAWEEMKENLGEGYEAEAEYHAIYALFYGEILNACKRKDPSSKIRKKIRSLKEAHPHWQKNPYLAYMGGAKKAFLLLVRMELICGIRILAWLHQKIVN